MEITLSGAPDGLERIPVDLSRAASKSLSGLLSQAPRALVGAGQVGASATRLTLVFKPSVARALAEGTAELVPSTVAKGAVHTIARAKDGKKIVGNASLLRKVNPLALAGAAWQLTSIITAQAHLADINKRLASLEEGVQSILQSIENREVAAIETNVRAMRGWIAILRDSRTSLAERLALVGQVVQIEREAQGRTRLLLREFQAHARLLRKQDWSSRTFSTDNEMADAVKFIEAAKHKANLCAISFEERLTAVQLRGAADLNEAYTETATQLILEDSRQVKAEWNNFAKSVKARVPELRAFLQSADSDRKDQAKLRRKLGQATSAVSKDTKRNQESVLVLREACENLLEARATPMTLEVEVDEGGQVLRACRLSEE